MTDKQPTITPERLDALQQAGEHPHCPMLPMSPTVYSSGPELAELVRGYRLHLTAPVGKPLPIDKFATQDSGLKFDAALKRACEEPTLVDALSWIAIWENDRAVRQALKGDRGPDGQLWDTCFLFCFRAVIEKMGPTQKQIDDWKQYEERYAALVTTCRETPNSACFCGCHISYVQSEGLPRGDLEAIRSLKDRLGKPNLDDIAERALFMFHIYPNYRVDSRGPAGVLLDILDKTRPDIARELRAEDASGTEIYHKHFADEPPEPDGPRGSDNPVVSVPSPSPPLTDLQEARRLLWSWVQHRNTSELHDAISCVVHHLENLGAPRRTDSEAQGELKCECGSVLRCPRGPHAGGRCNAPAAKVSWAGWSRPLILCEGCTPVNI